MHVLLFVYGTLKPRSPEDASRLGWAPDAVRGRLFDLGPYPALVDLGAPGADWVEGYVRPVAMDELAGPLDEYEGVAEGLYRRVEARTRAGREAWVYIPARPLPPGAVGPIARWDGPRAGPVAESGRVRAMTGLSSGGASVDEIRAIPDKAPGGPPDAPRWGNAPVSEVPP